MTILSLHLRLPRRNLSTYWSNSARPLFLTGATIAVVALAACGKSERQLTTEERLKAVQTKQETQPDFFVQRKSVDYMADLKAIRENTPKAEPAQRAETAATAPAAAKAEPQLRAAPTITTPVPAAAPVITQPAPQVAPAPVATVPTPAPAPVAAAPQPRAPSGDTTVTVVNREQPNFPREAVRQGVESGTVRARLSINAAGDVTSVTITSARPARVFDREVQAALQRWKFNPGADGRAFETEINFQR
jgi:TonB family protein